MCVKHGRTYKKVCASAYKQKGRSEIQLRSFKMGRQYMEYGISVIQTWQESDGSLRTCLRTYRAGDAADEVCVQIEQQMEDLMQGR